MPDIINIDKDETWWSSLCQSQTLGKLAIHYLTIYLVFMHALLF